MNVIEKWKARENKKISSVEFRNFTEAKIFMNTLEEWQFISSSNTRDGVIVTFYE